MEPSNTLQIYSINISYIVPQTTHSYFPSTIMTTKKSIRLHIPIDEVLNLNPFTVFVSKHHQSNHDTLIH